MIAQLQLECGVRTTALAHAVNAALKGVSSSSGGFDGTGSSSSGGDGGAVGGTGGGGSGGGGGKAATEVASADADLLVDALDVR